MRKTINITLEDYLMISECREEDYEDTIDELYIMTEMNNDPENLELLYSCIDILEQMTEKDFNKIVWCNDISETTEEKVSAKCYNILSRARFMRMNKNLQSMFIIGLMKNRDEWRDDYLMRCIKSGDKTYEAVEPKDDIIDIGDVKDEDGSYNTYLEDLSADERWSTVVKLVENRNIWRRLNMSL